jgi:hypothetical protein
MAVVINDFEVVTEPQPQTQSGNASPAEDVSQSGLLPPRDVKRMLRQQMERLARVRAH